MQVGGCRRDSQGERSVTLLGCNLASIRICIQGYLERPVRFLYIGTFVTTYQRVWGGGLGVRAERRLSEDRQSWECEDGFVLRKEKIRIQKAVTTRKEAAAVYCKPKCAHWDSWRVSVDALLDRNLRLPYPALPPLPTL